MQALTRTTPFYMSCHLEVVDRDSARRQRYTSYTHRDGLPDMTLALWGR